MVARKLSGRLTTKSQVTIPLAAREALGLKPHDRVEFQIDGKRLYIERAESVIDALYGIVEPLKRPEDWDEIENEFERGVADEVMSRYEESKRAASEHAG
jgi:AbrB family looped-hinge helix DNA binding protein